MKCLRFKRVVAFILLLSLLSGYIPCFWGSYNVQAADANALQINYINLMKGNKAGAGNTDAIMNLDDLRNVALYLSMSYVPFYTSLDGDSKDKWIEKSAGMLTQIGFDKSVANTLVSAVYEASLNSATPLYVNVGDIGKIGGTVETGAIIDDDILVDGLGRIDIDVQHAGLALEVDRKSMGESANLTETNTFYDGGYTGTSATVTSYVKGAGFAYGDCNPADICSSRDATWTPDVIKAAFIKTTSNTKGNGATIASVNTQAGQKFKKWTAAVTSSTQTFELALAKFPIKNSESCYAGADKDEDHTHWHYKLILVPSNSMTSNDYKFVLDGADITEGTKGLNNPTYKTTVKDEGYAGYTPLTLFMMWCMLDNYRNDIGVDKDPNGGLFTTTSKYTGYNFGSQGKISGNGTVRFYCDPKAVTVNVSGGSDEGGTETSTESDTEVTTEANAGSIFSSVLSLYAAEEESTEVPTETSPPEQEFSESDAGGLRPCAVIDKEYMMLLAYMAQHSEDANIGGILNSFVNGKMTDNVKEKNGSGTGDLSSGQFENLTACFQKLYVDWVGNILCDVGTERVIVVPACANKYTFTDIKGDAKQNILSPLMFSILRDSMAVSDVTGSGYTATNKTVKIPEIWQRGSAGKVTWDSETSWFSGFNTGTAGAMGDLLSSTYGFTVVGKGKQNWDTNGEYVLSFSSGLSSGDVLQDFLVYESIKQSGKGTVTGDWSSMQSQPLLEGWGSFKNYFSSTNKFSTTEKNNLYLNFSSNDTLMLQNLFLTYTFAYTNHPYKGETFDEDKHYIDMRFNIDAFPTVTGQIHWDSTDSTESEIMSFIYYFLHPTKGIKYVATWFRNKVGGILINWHEDVVGSSDSNTVTGMTQYLGFTGYVTTPNLEDISWISAILTNYNSIIIYTILLMAVILVCYVISGTITLQRGFVGLVMFAFLAFLPPVAINTAVNIINTVCDGIYGSKFDYWAAVQTEEYLGLLNEVENAITVTDYVTALMQTNAEASTSTSIGGASATGYSGVKVKWLSPKKFNEMAAFSDEVQDKIESSKSGLSNWTLNVLVASQDFATGMEFYVASDSATYLYRDLLDIYRYGSCSYYNFINDWGRDTTPTFSDSDITHLYRSGSDIGSGIKLTGLEYNKLVMANMGADTSNYSSLTEWIKGTSSLEHISQGYLYPTIDVPDDRKVNYYGGNKNTNAVSLFLYYPKCIELIINNRDTLKGMLESGDLNIDKTKMDDSKKYYGLPQWMFKNGINEFITGAIPEEYKNTDTEHTGSYDGYYYSLYSESPYYYFGFNIRDQATRSLAYKYDYKDLKASGSDDKEFYEMLLEDNQSYFFNNNISDGYGELRDFMNMHDLFYYIMPALQVGNDVVNMYADAFGMESSDHTTLVLGADGNISYNGGSWLTLEDMQKDNAFDGLTEQDLYDFWHDYNVRTVYNEYTPWLNLMYACDYAKPETIRVLGEKFYVENPLDPTSYFKVDANGNWVAGRYMIFSRSQMKSEGVLWNDLTEVEQKIITVQDNVYNQALRLMNYYNLSDETLISYLAMLEVFEFNKEFSQTSFVSTDYILYPQSYELKAFTYDAYLRLILNGATEGSNYQDELQVSGGQSIYERILEKTSLFFGIVLLVNDFVAVYLIPMLKLFFLVLIFFVSVLVIIAATTKMETPGGGLIQAVYKSLIAPLASFMGVSIGMAFLIALFMSEGGGTVTKRKMHISLGDPTMTCIAMLIINVCVLILYWKIIKKVWKDFETYVISVFDNVASNVVGAVNKVMGVVAGGVGLNGKRFRHHGGFGKYGIYSTPSQRGMNILHHAVRSSEGSGGGAGGMLTANANAVGNGSAPTKSKSGLNKYDIKAESLKEANDIRNSQGAEKLTQAQNRAADRYSRADAMREKYGEDSFQYRNARRKADNESNKAYNLKMKNDARNAKLQSKIAKLEDKGAAKAQIAAERKANIKAYGRSYGTSKNIGASAGRAKDKVVGIANSVKGAYNRAEGGVERLAGMSSVDRSQALGRVAGSIGNAKDRAVGATVGRAAGGIKKGATAAYMNTGSALSTARHGIVGAGNALSRGGARVASDGRNIAGAYRNARRIDAGTTRRDRGIARERGVNSPQIFKRL